MSSKGIDPILLSLMAQRLMSIAEAMGRTLAQTSISTNIKERLDYSCALFSPEGDLVANAPHLPVHLGSMSFAVRYQVDALKNSGGFKQGDVILSNHPVAGGSHLPDCTAISPAYIDGKIAFYVASRGHQTDVGGMTAGSMPPNSKYLYQEGAAMVSFKIVREGEYDREGLVKIMCDEPAAFPGCVGCRSFADVESDLQAQIAANQKGINLIGQLIDEYGLETVQTYMRHIRDNAEDATRALLRRVAKEQSKALHAVDYLDDGTPIELTVTIDEETGDAVFDFEGTGPETLGNLNTPVSVTSSAIIYCLRAMVDQPIPLNQGCLVPIEIRLPPGSILNPSKTAAVVGGNVCTSQRVTDVCLKAFGAAADSQGDCNNLTFGKNDPEGSSFGYYETIAGGSGAGPTWSGTAGTQVHMTNTRSTDPEILERRYPLILHQFAIRTGSGGKGRHNGGDGVIREIEFLEEMECSILSERRVFAPHGIEGGGDGLRGENTWVKQRRKEDGDLEDDEHAQARMINIGGKQTVKMGRGDRILVKTPGGGAYGAPSDDQEPQERVNAHEPMTRGSLSERQNAHEQSS
ncbi:uncharacterized protein L969DRAFT_89715 [Mixia osmundae IAM 14324]|uniref:Hydantoinase B/oxoprolinase domain-containing protein n=1 Tax=Mixia osmundae (strain CBS 9802 / IAM 14324 / JCM 22182 / KY 12970) TaxID=764103 RepID=G7E4X1_MIXOS|nr:uncharacterized protein L969DRAFT_89715 [Mixia osmundae IAM 14324]KEI37743.1 hypothetical protein L969DRAFT_89715 [Mixia osmundae IAM 14324]GAA97881.1 hypothetical protein E5Q_04561 [Mixia osmundae IAM 14324]